MNATLTIETVPGYRARRVVVDCEHGTTTVWTLAGATVIPDTVGVAMAIERHRAEQPGCRCIRQLERRYGQTRKGA